MQTAEKEIGRMAKNKKTSWHPAFVQAIQADLAAYRDILEFTPELPLTTEPLRIDLAIVKKIRDIVIDNSIARFFRKDNLLEYKSPTDSLSSRDFAQVHAYAYLYATITPDVDLADITLTFIENRYPRKFLQYLANVHGCKIEKPSPGIYLVERKLLPLQIVETKKLSEKENIFLKALTNRLRPDSMEAILEAKEKLEQAIRLDAYFHAVIKENPKAFKEVQAMPRKSLTIDDVLVEIGFTQRMEERAREQGIEQGIERGKEKIALNLIQEGMSIEKIAAIAELPVGKVRELAQNPHQGR
jgi:predicted transposase/invertase (TIGR01784 family)